MTDFLVTQMTLYPWFTWLLVVFFIAGIAWWSVFLAHGVMFVSDWSSKKREAWRYKTWVMRELREHPDGDDPPEYQHPDGDEREREGLRYPGEYNPLMLPDGDDELAEWEQDTAADERWGQDMADLAEVLRLAHERGLLDDEWETDLRRCDNGECGLVGMLHNGPCDVPTRMYLAGAAMPPQPVREFLHPAIMDDLKAAGFSEHETNDGALESAWTRAQSAEVIALIKDGIIPGKGQEDD